MTSIPDFVYDIVKKRIERDIMWYLISGADLEELLEQGKDMVLVDMRDRQSYEKGHICGAVHIPGEELMSRRASEGSVDCSVLLSWTKQYEGSKAAGTVGV